MLRDDLPENARLSYYVGEIVSWDVWSENEMRALCGRFDQAGRTWSGWDDDYGRMIPQLLIAIETPGVPEPFRALASSVTNAALRAHKKRSRYAHDILMPDLTKPDLVVSLIKRDPPRPIAEFAKTADEMRRLTWRLRGLQLIARSWLGPEFNEQYDWERAALLCSWTRVAMNHIADVPNEIRGTPGKCPEPPGGYKDIGD